MKKIAIFGLCLCIACCGMGLVPAVSRAQAPVIQLPDPDVTAYGRPLMDCLRDRMSQRSYSTEMLSPQVMSNLLYAAWGINRPGSDSRTAPSGHSVNDVTIFVTLEQGVYTYDAANHELDLYMPGDIRILTAIDPMKGYVAPAPVNFLYVHDLTKDFGPVPDVVKMMISFAHAGVIAENAYLFCASEGLATTVRGALPEDLPAILGLPPTMMISLAQTFGYNALSHITYFPAIRTAGSADTVITIMNNSEIPWFFFAELRGFNDKGQQIANPMNLSFGSPGIWPQVPPFGSVVLDVSEVWEAADQISYITLMAPMPTASGFVELYDNGEYVTTIPATSAPSDAKIKLTDIVSDDDTETRISLVNTTTEIKEVKIKFSAGKDSDDDDCGGNHGNCPEKDFVTLFANGGQSFTVADFFDGEPQPWVKKVVIKDAEGIIAAKVTGSRSN